MNLPTFAVILEDHVLSKVYGASKVVHMVNTEIQDPEQHIAVSMTGRDISTIYKALGYAEQSVVANLVLFDDSETSIIINQLELLNTSTDTESKMSATLRELVVLFAATILVLIACVISLGYYENARQNNMVIDSKIFALISKLINTITPDP